MDRGGTGGSDCAAHAGGVHGSGRPAARIERFVERTFDSFASSFEAKLEKLSYRAPALVAATLERSGLVPSKSLDTLDAGCGTGLCGPLVAPYARRLTGVDLSEGMLAHAKQKHIYDDWSRPTSRKTCAETPQPLT